MRMCFVYYGVFTLNDNLTPLYEYTRRFSENGIDVTLLVLHHDDNIKSSGNLKVQGVCPRYFSSKITHLIFLFKLIRIIKAGKYDVVHVFNLMGCSLLPIFCRKQEQWILDIRTGAIFSKIRKYIYDWFTASESKCYDKVCMLNENCRKALFGRRKEKNVCIIPLGADVERFTKIKRDKIFWRKYGIKENVRVLIYCGKIDKTRQLEVLLRAYKRVLETENKQELLLVVVGGDGEDLNRLKEDLVRLCLGNRVMCVGKIPYRDVADYIANADLGLAYIPKNSLYDAQPPLKTCEYLAASLPVVATNTMGNMEVVKDGYNGVIVPDNEKGFSEGIIKILSNDNLFDNMKHNAVGSVRKYDWGSICEELISSVYCAQS